MLTLVSIYGYRVARIGNIISEQPRCYVQDAMAALVEKTFGNKYLMDNHMVLEFSAKEWDDPQSNPEHRNVFLSLSDGNAKWGTLITFDKDVVWQHQNEPKNVWANAHTVRKVE